VSNDPERFPKNRLSSDNSVFADDRAIRLPKLEQHEGVDVIRFQNEWQIKLLFEDTFIDFVTEYIESHEPPYKMILQLDAIHKLSLTDLGNLVAVFTPFIDTDGVIVICHLHPGLENTCKVHLMDCDFLLARDLESAIFVVKAATGN
jgi:hypothetical protein